MLSLDNPINSDIDLGNSDCVSTEIQIDKTSQTNPNENPEPKKDIDGEAPVKNEIMATNSINPQ